MPDPSAPDFGTPQAVQDVNLGTGQALAQAGNQAQQQQAAQTPPQQGWRPNIMNLFDAIRGPRSSPGGGLQPARPVSRLDAFESFVGNFLNSLSSGLSQAGRGPGANLRGFGAAVQAPYQREVQQYGMQQQARAQQAGLEAEQARTRLTGAQTELAQAQAASWKRMVPVQIPGVPGGTVPMPEPIAKALYPAQLKSQTAVETTGMRTASAEKIAGDKIAAAQGGIGIPLDSTTANLIGMPEKAGQSLTGKDWGTVNKALTARGYKVQDLGAEGAWIIDRAGNRIKQVGTSPSMARGIGFAYGRAMYTPFETVVPGTNIPTTISNLEALKSGAAKVPIGQQAKFAGQYSLFKDAYGILGNISTIADKVNLDDAAVRNRVTAAYAAVKDPAGSGATGETLNNILLRQPINRSLSSDERELVLNMAQGKAAATGLRSVIGQAGANEFQQRLDSAMFPSGGALANTAALKQQVGAVWNFLDRFVQGQVQVGLNAPGAGTALRPGMRPGAPTTGGTGPLSLAEAQDYLRRAGGNKDIARQLAKAAGRTF